MKDAVHDRHASSFTGKTLSAIRAPAGHEAIDVDSERKLLAMARPLAKRLADDPDFSVMLLANPVLALAEYGITLSPRLQKHVLQALRHPKILRERRAELEKSLTEALGEPPRPNDPKWLATLVFETRAIPPRDAEGRTPVYRTADIDAAIAVAQRGRPAATKRYPGVRRIAVTSRMGVAAPQPTVRRLDLTAPVPELPALESAPAELTIEQAWFYKDDAIVHDAVELGQIERRGFPFRTPAQFRKVQAGEIVDGFRAFVTRIRIDPGKTP